MYYHMDGMPVDHRVTPNSMLQVHIYTEEKKCQTKLLSLRTARLETRLPYLVGHHAPKNEHGLCKICTQRHTSIMHKCFESIQ